MANLVKAPTKDFVSTTLNGAINDSTQTITLTSTTNMQAPGYVVIDRENVSTGEATPNSREVVYFTGISGSDITGCTRGANNSTARSHSSGALVETNMTVGTWNNRMVVDNNEPFQAKDSGGTVRNLINLNASDQLVIGANNVADHTVINAGTSKLVKIKVLQQDDTTDSYKENSVILTGWGYIVGTGGSRFANKTVTFGVTFAARPIVVVGFNGIKANSAPSHIGDTSGSSTLMAGSNSIGTTSFTAEIQALDSGNIANTSYGSFTWVAVGQLS